MNAPDNAVETMLAECRIRDVIARYARGVDRRDEDRIRDCYHPDAVTHYGVFDGNLDEFIPWVLAYVAEYSNTMHFLGQSIIDWPNGRLSSVAIVETYAIALHQKDGGDRRENWVGGIRYIDRFERRMESADSACSAGSWKIAERTVVGAMNRREELRGLLGAYQAKAARLGAAEDPGLTERYDRARGLLWTAPCDLAAAADAVAGYQRAVLALGGPPR